MRRVSEFGAGAVAAAEVASGAIRELNENGQVDWNRHVVMRPHETRGFQIETLRGDACEISLARVTEKFEALFPRRERTSGRSIDPDRREVLATQGLHAEPALIIPVGEIVNGTLAQLRRIDMADE